MDNKEITINSNIFGGYNKKDTIAYIEKLQEMIDELQKELETASQLNAKYLDKIKDSEEYYKTLWNKSTAQEEEITRLSSELGAAQEHVKTLQNDNNELKDHMNDQMDLLNKKEDVIDKLQTQVKQHREKIKEQLELTNKSAELVQKYKMLYHKCLEKISPQKSQSIKNNIKRKYSGLIQKRER